MSHPNILEITPETITFKYELNQTFWNDDKLLEKADAIESKLEELPEYPKNTFPPRYQIFRALRLLRPDQVKVLIIGQDPYHTPGCACGLSFSVETKSPAPSLRNIFKELEADGFTSPRRGILYPSGSGDLLPWVRQGVLLLNTALTVKNGSPASHSKEWNGFATHIIKLIPPGYVAILWGGHAQSFKYLITSNKKNLALCSSHPSPMSANGGFFGSKPFSKCNVFLQKNGKTPIDWNL
jgi:uracil-DNA glycosylase